MAMRFFKAVAKAVPRLIELLRDESYVKSTHRSFLRVADRANVALQAISGRSRGGIPESPLLGGLSASALHDRHMDRLCEDWEKWWDRSQGFAPDAIRRKSFEKCLAALAGRDSGLEAALDELQEIGFVATARQKISASTSLARVLEKARLGPSLQLKCRELLAQFDPGHGLDELLRFARDNDVPASARLEAIRTLSVLGDDRWTEPALLIADSGRCTLQERCLAIDTLALRGTESVSFLVAVARRHAAASELLSDDDREIYSCAIMALSRITKEFVPPKPPFSRAARLRQVAPFDKWEAPSTR